MHTRTSRMALCAVAAWVLPLDSARAAEISVFADPADARTRDTGPAYDGNGNSANETTQTTRRNGHFSGGNEDDFLVYPFQLPPLNGEDLQSATLSLYYHSKVGTPAFNGILTALDRTSASAVVQASDHQATGTVLDAAHTTPSTVANQYIHHSSAALLEFLGDAYASAGAGNFVFFRLSHVDPADPGTGLPLGTAYEFRMREFSPDTGDPLLTIVTVPEPSSTALAAATVGVLLARRRRRTTR